MTHWGEQAQCKGAPTELFFAAEGQLTRHAEEEQLQVIAVYCNRCPVKAECLASSRGERGVWGGMTEEQRGIRTRPRKATP